MSNSATGSTDLLDFLKKVQGVTLIKIKNIIKMNFNHADAALSPSNLAAGAALDEPNRPFDSLVQHPVMVHKDGVADQTPMLFKNSVRRRSQFGQKTINLTK